MIYEKEKSIYSGPFCDVYKATSETGIVALKVVDLDFLKKPHDFRQEVALLRRLRHPAIAQYLDSYTVGDDRYLVMPYYQIDMVGVMNHYLKRKVKFNLDNPEKNTTTTKNEIPVTDLPKTVTALASAVQFVHSQGIIHRDIKPANVFFHSIDRLDEPLLGDFGIAYDMRNPPSDEPANKKVTDVSTGYYKAPELCFGVTDYSTEIDLWSLGIVISYLYSANGKPANFVEGEADFENNAALNDFVLIQGTFEAFGTPTITETSSPVYWGRLADPSCHFLKFSYKQYPRKSTRQLLPRCNDDTVALLFERLTTYEGRDGGIT